MIDIDDRRLRVAVTTHGPFLVSKLLEEALDRIIQLGSLDPDDRTNGKEGITLTGIIGELEEAECAASNASEEIKEALAALREAESKAAPSVARRG